jgi:hypothetical protein
MAHSRLQFLQLDDADDQQNERRDKNQNAQANKQVIHQRLTIRWDNR